MGKRKNEKISEAVAVLLAVVILAFAAGPSARADDVCERALVKCLVDAAVAAVLSGPEAGAAFALACLNGYTWCLMYYQEFEKQDV